MARVVSKFGANLIKCQLSLTRAKSESADAAQKEAQGCRPCTSQPATASREDAAAPHAADTIPTDRRDTLHRGEDHEDAMVWRRTAVARAMGGVW